MSGSAVIVYIRCSQQIQEITMSDKGLIDQILREARALATYAVGRGLDVPPEAVQAVADAPTTASEGEVDLPRLLAAHQALARLVTPATPRDIAYFVGKGHDELASAKRLVGWMLGVAVVSLLGFLIISTSEYVGDPQYGDIHTSQGIPLLVNEVFYLFAAGLGASFWILMEALTRLRSKEYSIDDSLSHTSQFLMSSQFWLRFMLGLVAGLILATLIEINTEASAEAGAHMTGRLTAAAMALLGGFSARAVFKILYRIVVALEDVISSGEASRSRATADEEMLTAMPQARPALLQAAGEQPKGSEQVKGSEQAEDSDQAGASDEPADSIEPRQARSARKRPVKEMALADE
jgi:hypothetical protein